MNVAAVADTHTSVWYVFNDPRLSKTARQFIEQTAEQVFLPLIPLPASGTLQILAKHSWPSF
jgi:PIN domain nuclease of toxin-antitoxin system